MALPVWVRFMGKRLIRSFGYELSRAGERGSLSGFLSHMREVGLKPATVIDVGVAHGTPELYQGFPDAYQLLVEPVAAFEPYIKQIMRDYEGDAVFAAAASEKGSRTLLLNPQFMDGGSLLVDRASTPGACDEVTVPTERLDDLCRARGLVGPFVIKADVQGTELEVVDGASGILSEVELIILEVSLFQFKHGNPEFADVVSRMRDLGYVVYELWGPSYRGLDGALAQLDVAFVKEGGQFRSSHLIRQVDQEREQL